MPSKSEKRWSGVSSSLLALTLAALPLPALATVRLGSPYGGQSSGYSTYYAVKPHLPQVTGSTGLLDSDPEFNFAKIDISAYAAAESGTRPNMLRLNISSDKAKAIPGQKYLSAQVFLVPASGTPRAVSIASVNGVPCYSGLCQSAGVAQAGLENKYFAATYSAGSVTEIGLYVGDICTDFVVQNGIVSFPCGVDPVNGGRYTVDVSSGLASLPIRVDIRPIPDESAAPTVAVQDTGNFNLNFQTKVPSLNCGGIASPASIYFPGDQEILLTTDAFGIGTSGTTLALGSAPPMTVIVVGNEGAPPVVDQNYLGANTLLKRVTYGGSRRVEGFINTTDGSDHKYGLGFMVRDASGVLAQSASCVISDGVQTSSIRGFLQKSSCFIATAAFRSENAAPVRMLRAFRDRVLLRSFAGRAFVRWYYSWSPGAAEWLMRNPGFRYPVLLALLPIQGFAWLCLHPMASCTLALSLACLLGCAVFRRRSAAC